MSDKKSQQDVSLNKCSVPGWDELADNKIKEIETLLRSIAKCLDTRYAPWKLIIPKGKLLKAFDGIRDWAAEPTWFLVSSHDKLCAIRLKFTYRLSGRLIVHAIYPPFPRYSNETGFILANQVVPEQPWNNRRKAIEDLEKKLTIMLIEPKLGFQSEKIASEIMGRVFPIYMASYSEVCERVRSFENSVVDFRTMAVDAGVPRTKVRKAIQTSSGRPYFSHDYVVTKNGRGGPVRRVRVKVEECHLKAKPDKNGDESLIDIDFCLDGISKAQARTVLSVLQGLIQRELKTVPKYKE